MINTGGEIFQAVGLGSAVGDVVANDGFFVEDSKGDIGAQGFCLIIGAVAASLSWASLWAAVAWASVCPTWVLRGALLCSQ
jgi:hypothetical protein